MYVFAPDIFTLLHIPSQLLTYKYFATSHLHTHKVIRYKHCPVITYSTLTLSPPLYCNILLHLALNLPCHKLKLAQAREYQINEFSKNTFNKTAKPFTHHVH